MCEVGVPHRITSCGRAHATPNRPAIVQKPTSIPSPSRPPRTYTAASRRAARPQSQVHDAAHHKWYRTPHDAKHTLPLSAQGAHTTAADAGKDTPHIMTYFTRLGVPPVHVTPNQGARHGSLVVAQPVLLRQCCPFVALNSDTSAARSAAATGDATPMDVKPTSASTTHGTSSRMGLGDTSTPHNGPPVSHHFETNQAGSHGCGRGGEDHVPRNVRGPSRASRNGTPQHLQPKGSRKPPPAYVTAVRAPHGPLSVSAYSIERKPCGGSSTGKSAHVAWHARRTEVCSQ